MRIARSCSRVAAIAALLAPTAWVSAQTQPLQVVIDHQSGIENPVAKFELKRGDRLKVSVINTDLSCFEFSQTQVISQTVQNIARLANKSDTVEYDIIHDGETSKYVIEAKKKASCTNTNLSERKWEIEILTFGWSIGFAGAFTVDQLTDPVFALKQTSTDSMNRPIYSVSRNRDAEDDYKLGAAAMMHLFHTNPNYLGKEGVAWAPISFGLGVGDDSKARYFIGTTLRFDTRLFLTAGRVFGPVKRLPDSLNDNSTTMDGNALQNLPTHTADAWFVGLSYTFAGVDLASPFSGRFKTTTPTATGAK